MGPPNAAHRRLRTTTNNAPAFHRQRVWIAQATLGCTVAMAACGGTSPKPTASSNSELALSHCMRAHGVPNFPDPIKGPGGEGMTINETPGSSTLTVEGIPFSGPAFQTAEQACKLFGGGSGPPPISESQKVAELHFAQCVRKHGVPNFPDPEFPTGGRITRPASAGQSRNSPAVRHAAAVCNKA